MITDVNNYVEQIIRSDDLIAHVSLEVYKRMLESFAVINRSFGKPLLFAGKRIVVEDEYYEPYICQSCGAIKEKIKCIYCGER